jgi:hypothetical protein
MLKAEAAQAVQAAIAPELTPGERIAVAMRCARGGYIAATDRGRVFVLKKPSLTGVRVSTRSTAFDPKGITGIQVHTGPISGWIVVHAAGYPIPQDHPEAVSADNARSDFKDAQNIVGQIRQLVESGTVD